MRMARPSPLNGQALPPSLRDLPSALVVEIPCQQHDPFLVAIASDLIIPTS